MKRVYKKKPEYLDGIYMIRQAIKDSMYGTNLLTEIE